MTTRRSWVVRDVAQADAAELADLLNAVIAKGGTTALEDRFTPGDLEQAYLVGRDVLCCLVAVDEETGRIEGFQTLGRPEVDADAAESIGAIGTFVRVDGAQRGVGSALFDATRARARALGLVGIDAQIRADNSGGLTFYDKLGFVDRHVITAVPLKDGRPVDRIVKRHALT